MEGVEEQRLNSAKLLDEINKQKLIDEQLDSLESKFNSDQ